MNQKEFKKFLGTARVCAHRHWKELLNKDELGQKHPGGFVPVFFETSRISLIGFFELKAIVDYNNILASRELVIYGGVVPSGNGRFVKYNPHIIQIDELITAFPMNKDRFGKKLVR